MIWVKEINGKRRIWQVWIILANDKNRYLNHRQSHHCNSLPNFLWRTCTWFLGPASRRQFWLLFCVQFQELWNASIGLRLIFLKEKYNSYIMNWEDRYCTFCKLILHEPRLFFPSLLSLPPLQSACYFEGVEPRREQMQRICNIYLLTVHNTFSRIDIREVQYLWILRTFC